jgi:hypothetical protein
LLPLENVHANETIQYHGNQYEEPNGVSISWENRDAIPYRSIVEYYAEEHPVWVDRTPKLLCYLLITYRGNATYCYTAIHMALFRSVDEEKGYSRDEYKGSNYTKVFQLELPQSFGIVSIEDNKEDIKSHGECPEHVRRWKPITVNCNPSTSNYGRTFASRSLGSGIRVSRFLPLAR